MKVICAGLGKTGTKSLNAALTHLGYNVYDYPDSIYLHRKEWIALFEGRLSVTKLKQIFNGFDACVDAPASIFWEEILNQFPDAKVILNVRDNEEVWKRSIVKQSVQLRQSLFFMLPMWVTFTGRNIRTMINCIARTAYSLKDVSILNYRSQAVNEPMLTRAYRRHSATVLQRCPKDKVLIYNCKEGWDPLCKFLGVPVPDMPFPRKNVRGQFLEDMMANHPLYKRLKAEVAVTFFVFLAILLSLLITLC